jgi:hypothetical protein
MSDAFVLGGVRTPVGRYGGSLSHVRCDDLLGQTMVWACKRVGVELDRIEDIAAGCVNVAHEGMGDIARWAALAAGFPDSVPAATVNRFCASSLTCAIQISHAIRAGELAVGLAGGVESMSRSGALRSRSSRYGVLGVCVGSGQAIVLASGRAAAELGRERQHVAGARGSERMSDRDGAAVRVQLLVGDLEPFELVRQLAQDRERDRGVRLVDLRDVDLLWGQAGSLQSSRDRRVALVLENPTA